MPGPAGARCRPEGGPSALRAPTSGAASSLPGYTRLPSSVASLLVLRPLNAEPDMHEPHCREERTLIPYEI
eukprot:1223283-Lingulodinium_polyedra.AAC.1